MGEKNRRLGFLVATLMTVVAVGGGWVAYSEISSRLAVRKDVGPALAAAAPPEALVLGQSLRETAERLDAPYRLGVDRRFRFAKSLLQGAGLNQPAEWKQDFTADDPWSAEHPFPSPPTFEAALSELMILAGTGAAEEERAPVVEDPGTWILAPESALRVIAHQTKESPKPKDALAATRAAISLLHGGVDRLSTADELGGIALAWLVWTEQARKEQRTAERAVLALELGYAEAAARFGQKLGQGPWRARLTFDDRALAAEAQGAPGLWFQRQSELGRAEERDTWESLPGSVRFGLSGLASSLRSDAFQTLGRTSALCAVPIELRIAALAGADVKEPIRKLEAARSIPAMLMAIPEARGHLIGQAVVHLGVGSGTLSDL